MNKLLSFVIFICSFNCLTAQAQQFNVVKYLTPGYSSTPSFPVHINGISYFTASTANEGNELWKSNGTTAGTQLLKDINPGAAGSGASELVNMNGVLYFSATNSANGLELWRSDGTEAGTFILKDIVAGTGNSSPTNLTTVYGTLFFFQRLHLPPA